MAPAGLPRVTNATKRLLDHWNSDQPEPRLFFAQREAIETLIYLYEIASPSSEPWEALNKENQAYNEGIRRLATKMATGTGKTAVMALIIIWQSVNHSQTPRDRRFTNQFAVITPGITVRDRNRQDLIPNREPNIYTGWNLVPRRSAYLRAVENAKVSITNFHSLQLREISWGQASSRAKSIARMKIPTENGREMIKRALGNLDPKGRIMVLNDEGHDCHNTNSQLIKVQAEDRKTADIWFNGIREIKDTGRLHTAIDLSATPLFITKYGAKTNDQGVPLDGFRLPPDPCHRVRYGQDSEDSRRGRRQHGRIPGVPEPLRPVSRENQAGPKRTHGTTGISTQHHVRELSENRPGLGEIQDAAGLHHRCQ